MALAVARPPAVVACCAVLSCFPHMLIAQAHVSSPECFRCLHRSASSATARGGLTGRQDDLVSICKRSWKGSHVHTNTFLMENPAATAGELTSGAKATHDQLLEWLNLQDAQFGRLAGSNGTAGGNATAAATAGAL